MPDEALDTVIAYHERTKHHLNRYARSLGYLDWATQPDPFRRYESAELLPLDLIADSPTPTYDQLFTPGAIPPAPLTRRFISDLFFHSLALSAWKEAGESRWALRVNPSSGNLHPTEGYLVGGSIDGLSDAPALFHYAPREHALEKRGELDADLWPRVQRALPRDTVFIGLSSIYWREAWKYGERAFRYCMHDAGHAIAAVSIAASMLGWKATLVEPGDLDLSIFLGIYGQRGPEAEHADTLIAVFPGTEPFPIDRQRQFVLLEPLLHGIRATGTPNVLSAEHHDWPVIDGVSRATENPDPIDPAYWQERTAPPPSTPERSLPARRIIRQRRSAVDMDGETSIPRDVFYLMLQRVDPYLNPVPFDALPWKPAVHLAIFVHRVEGLAPGVYLHVREPSALDALKRAITRDFAWRRSTGCPDNLNLFLLHEADARSAARTISCHQDIAADGAFALGMLAEFEPALRRWGPWFYKRLFWETGVIGQVLYLEAQAAGIRSTGIGCFFDDAMHEVLGVRDRSFQSLYHFTVGGPVEDPRLRTLDAYAHLSTTRR